MPHLSYEGWDVFITVCFVYQITCHPENEAILAELEISGDFILIRMF
jgi:hypothetical protein